MRLLIVEPDAEGHHLALYTRLILRESRRRNWGVTLLTTRSAVQHPAFQIAAGEGESALSTVLMNDLAPPRNFGSIELLRCQHRLWRALRTAVNDNRNFAEYDLIYCVNFDYFEKALSILGSPFGQRPFAGMMMNPKFHRSSTGLGPRSRSDFVYQVLFQRLLGITGLASVLVVDEPFRDHCARTGLRNNAKIRLVPDVGELGELPSKEDSRAQLEIADSKFVILVFGSLTDRKGLEHLLQAVSRLGCADVVVLAAGKPDESMQAFLDSAVAHEMARSGQLIVRAAFLDSAGEAQVFSAADAVWLGYVGGAYGSSGVLYQAGAAGLPVIAMEEGLIGWMTRNYQLGVTVDPTDHQRVAEEILSLKNDTVARRRSGENGRRLAALHTGPSFGRAICDALEDSIATSRPANVTRSS